MLSKILKVSAVMIVVIFSSSLLLAEAIPSSGMILWLKADAGVTKDGSNNVSGWADQSGNGHNAAASGSLQPTYVANAANGMPGLSFNGGNQMVIPTSSALDLGQAPNGAMTVILVALGNGTPGWSAAIEKASGGNSQNTDYAIQRWMAAGPVDTSTWCTGLASDPVASYVYNSPSTTAFHITAANIANDATGTEGTKNLWIDGGRLGTTDMAYSEKTAAATLDDLYIGGSKYNYPGYGWQGNIAEVLMYNRVLSASELNDVGYALGQKYGISTSYVPEPGALTLLITGLFGLLAYAWRKRR